MTQAERRSKWLVNHFLMRGSLNMVYASAGVGKSLLSLELAYFLAKKPNVSKVIYLDGDNSEAALTARGLNEIVESSGAKLEYYFVNPHKYFSIFNKLKEYNLENVVLIIDSIRNFINFDIKDDIKVTRYLQRLQKLRSKGATIIFLHHQPKQYGEENNKMYKGATAFIDSVDEAWYVSKSFIQNSNSKTLSLDLEPQKYRLDTKAQRAIIDNKTHTIFFRDDIRIGLSQKQQITLELAQEVINANPNGIIQSDLARQIVKIANANYYEIVGKNSLWNLLAEFENKLFKIHTFTPKGGGVRKIYTPLNTAIESKTSNKIETKIENTPNLIKAVITESKNGIAQKDLAELVCKKATNNLEIVGKNSLWKLLDKYDGVFYRAEKTYRKSGYGITKIYLPLLDSNKSMNSEIMVG
ncbi:AAA family ATPase [Helicobacter cinaedi]|uniref:AAA family ATPase n=1 Tax=Helicobacter cinaedi TaxID=213 RepID=UPI0010580914|nr:AAA family ATPase [Helicobacter cinaedi]